MLRLGAGTIPPKRLREAVSVCGHVLTVSDLNRVLSEAGAAAGLVSVRDLEQACAESGAKSTAVRDCGRQETVRAHC